MITLLRYLKGKLKKLAEKIFNITIYRTLPRGIDTFHDLERIIPKWKPTTFFDVGANIGQSAVLYARKFPSAKVLSFEPCAETFQRLEQNMAGFPNVQCIKLALGSQVGTGVLAFGADSSANRIVINNTLTESGRSETVRQTTIDDFCKQQGIQKIDYLKVDAEGADLDVLRGAEQMLGNGLIDVVEIEAGIGLDNELHVPLTDFRSHLEPRGYSVFGFYEQVHEFKRELAHLRRTNVVFISKALEVVEKKATC